MPKLFDRLHIFVLTVDERILEPRDVPCTSAMKERTRFEQNEVETQGFTMSSGLEIEITEPEGQRFPPPQKKEGARGEGHRESRGGDWTRGGTCPSQQALVLKLKQFRHGSPRHLKTKSSLPT